MSPQLRVIVINLLTYAAEGKNYLTEKLCQKLLSLDECIKRSHYAIFDDGQTDLGMAYAFFATEVRPLALSPPGLLRQSYWFDPFCCQVPPFPHPRSPKSTPL